MPSMSAANDRQRRPRALDDQLAQVFAPAFGDPEQLRLAARCRLARHQAEPGGEITAAAEGAPVTDGCHQRRCIDHRRCRDCWPAAARPSLRAICRKLVVERRDPIIERLPLAEHVIEQTCMRGLNPAASPATDVRRPHSVIYACLAGTMIPRSSRMARIWFINDVRWPTSRSRTRCRTCMSSCASLLSAHKLHCRPGRCFGNRLRVPVVILLRLDIRPDILRRHEPHLVSSRDQDPPQMMCAAARLHRDNAAGQLGREGDNTLPPHPPTQQNGRRSHPARLCCSCSCPGLPQVSERPSCRPPVAYPIMVEKRGGPFHKGGLKLPPSAVHAGG